MTKPTGRPRGRPRTRPIPDPNAPKRPVGRPRKIFYDRESQVNPPRIPKRNPGRPKNTERSVAWAIVLPESMSDQLDKLQGVWGPTRSSVLQAIVRTYLNAIGDEGVAALKRANQYGNVIERRRVEAQAKRALVQLTRAGLVKRSGGWMDGNGAELFRNE